MAKFLNSGLDSEGRTVLRIPPKDVAKYLAAPAMYEALKTLNYQLTFVNIPFSQALQALAKAEGKEVNNAEVRRN